jgi:endonuclease/exonuclease/phosphatase (EEP) superfamily protein YafD
MVKNIRKSCRSLVLISLIALPSLLGTIPNAQAQTGLIFNMVMEETFRRPKSSETITLLGKAREDAFKPHESFEVLIWNVHKAEDPNWFSEFQELGKNSKLILVQEAYFTSQFNQTLLQFDDSQWVSGISFQMLHQQYTGTGVTTGSSVQTIKRDYVRTVFTEPVVKTSKLTLLTYYPIKGRSEQLLAINIHAINFVPTFVFRSELKRLSESLKEHTGPIILGGDFNTWTEGRKKALDGLAKRHQLTPIEFPDGARSTGLGKILDHAFTRGLEVNRVDHLGHITTSDHKPLRFKVRIQ